MFFLEPWGLEGKLAIPSIPKLPGSRVISVDINITEDLEEEAPWRERGTIAVGAID